MKTNQQTQLTYNEVKALMNENKITFIGTNRFNVVPSKNFVKSGNSLLMQQNSASYPVFHTIGYFN